MQTDLEENPKIDHTYTSEIVCPHCGYEHGDSWEMPNSGSQDCDNCEKSFSFERDIEVTYCTSKQESQIENEINEAVVETATNPNRQVCPQYPHFGARYPDATCIDGYLWDLDSGENGLLTHGGEDPCPFCNTEAYLEG